VVTPGPAPCLYLNIHQWLSQEICNMLFTSSAVGNWLREPGWRELEIVSFSYCAGCTGFCRISALISFPNMELY
jgi:hypothetical protein